MKQPLVGRFFACLSLLAGLLAFSAPAANATVIVGTLNITGAGTVAISNGPNPGDGIIDFRTDPGLDVDLDGKGTGRANIVSGNTGVFAGLALGQKLTMRDLNNADVPINAPNQNFLNFITFDDQPSWSVTLTELRGGIFNPAGCLGPVTAGQSCSFPGAPFNFINTTTHSSVVSATFTGIATDGVSSSQVEGTFEATFSNRTFQDLINASALGPVVTSYSATISAVPEPASASMMLIGGLLVAGGIVARRRLSR